MSEAANDRTSARTSDLTADLAGLVAAWTDARTRFVGLVATLLPDAWALPTGCPQWSVHEVVAHVADLESRLARSLAGPLPDPGARTGGEVSAAHTAGGVRDRADSGPADLLDEIAAAGATIATRLPDPATMLQTLPPPMGDVQWDWPTLLRNRVIDLTCHEVDVRDAVGLAVDLDGPGGRVVVGTLAAAQAYVLGARVRPPAGTALRIVVEGVSDDVLVVGEDGRARRRGDAGPDATITLTAHRLVALGAGRTRCLAPPPVVDGDVALADRHLAAMAITP